MANRLILQEKCKDEDHQLKIALIGGPGTGKTFTITEAQNLASPRPFICCAAYGSAAASLPGGSTICQVFGFNAQKKRNYGVDKEMRSLSDKFMPTVFARLHKQFVEEQGILVVDEVSLLTAVNLYHISKTLQDLMQTQTFKKDEVLTASNRYHLSSQLHAESDFGGVNVMLAGDWFQIPGIGMGLPEAVMHLILEKDVPYGKVNKKSLAGANKFLEFTKLELHQNVRSGKDPKHSAMVASISDFNKRYPVTEDFILHLKNKTLTSKDLLDDATWLEEGLFLTSNNETRKCLNYCLAREFCKLRKEVLIMYPLEIKTTYDDLDILDTHMTQDDLRAELRKKYPDMWGYYIKSGPAVLTRNLKPELKLANGSQVYFHSMIFDPKDTFFKEVEKIISDAKPGSVVQLPIAPSYIIVEAPKLDIENFSLEENEMLDGVTPTRDNYICYAVPTYGTQNDRIRNPIVKDKILTTCEFKEARIEMLFSCTFHKAQGC